MIIVQLTKNKQPLNISDNRIMQVTTHKQLGRVKLLSAAGNRNFCCYFQVENLILKFDTKKLKHLETTTT